MRSGVVILLLAGMVAMGNCVGVDMGQCSCLCGSSSETSILSQGSNMPASTYYDRLRGPSGGAGRPGKAGPQGIPGAAGPRGPRGPPGKSIGDHGSWMSPSSSCFDLLTKGTTASGIYTIKPENFNDPMQVYCDLQSAGGGWTLVASIHENNIDGKCTIGDKWSSEQGATVLKNGETSSSWQNFEVFGNPLSATSADYKSPAYFALDATDVMLWHVPNDVSIMESMDQATLRYYTDNQFLTKYGGNLRLMFDKYYPMKKVSNTNSNTRGLEGLMAALNQSSAAIRNCVPNFYNYVYDFDGSDQNYIKDGGQDMFDTGNKVFYKIGSHTPVRITYNEHYRNTSQVVEVMSSTEHPFETLMWIGNNDRSTNTFSLRVESGTGADGDGSYRTLTGTLPAMGNLTAKYIAYVISGASDPSICEVFYYIANVGGWGSVEPTSFTQAQWASTTDNVNLEVQLDGRPSSILAGYTLLSRRDPIAVTEEQVQAAVTEIMRTVSEFGKIDEYNCGRLNDSVVEPVNYLTGDDATVMAGIPPFHSGLVTPGYVQFRSLSPTGEPNAICPGVKSESCRPSSYCVGGVNTMTTNPDACGDFAGWAGGVDDEPTDTAGAGSAKPQNDLRSTILMFTRNEPSN